MAQKIAYQDANGYHLTEEPEGTVKTKANILDMSPGTVNSGGLPIRQAQVLSDKQREEIAKQNEETARKPVIKLEKVWYDDQKRFELLEREGSLAFLKVSELSRNPDGSIPQVSNKNRKVTQSYWVIGRIVVRQSPVTDAFGISTGQISQRREVLSYNPSIELTKTNAMGMPISGELGFNIQKDRVYSAFIDQKIRDRQDADAAVLREREATLVMAQAAKVAALRLELRPKLAAVFAELKQAVLTVKKPTDVLTDRKVMELADQYNRIETILKSLTK